MCSDFNRMERCQGLQKSNLIAEGELRCTYFYLWWKFHTERKQIVQRRINKTFSRKLSILCFNFFENFHLSLLFRENLDLWLCKFSFFLNCHVFLELLHRCFFFEINFTGVRQKLHYSTSILRINFSKKRLSKHRKVLGFN